MYMPTESLRPMTYAPALPPVVVTDTTAREPSAPAPVGAAHDVIGEAAALQRVACRSFQVNGAQVDVQRVLFGIVPWLASERCDVESISKGGVSFECRYAIAAGETVELSLRVPGERAPIALKAEVTRCKRARYGGYHIGARFAPYGESLGRNPRSALAALRALEAKHT